MMAYEMGEIWHDDGEGESKVFDHDGHVVALCRTPEQARLIAESPERDDLLREMLPELRGLAFMSDLASQWVKRIEETIRRADKC